MSYSPGRDLDREMAIQLLGLKVDWDFENLDWVFIDRATKNWRPLPHFSTDTNDSYIIINYLQTKGYYNQVGSTSGGVTPVWRASFFTRNDKVIVQQTGETLAHAVCVAALELLKNSTNIVQFPKEKAKIKEEMGKVIQFPGKKKED